MKINKKHFISVQYFLLFFIPVIYFLVGSYFRNLLGDLSLRSCDPDYIYFMSGLTLSDGNLKLGHFDNPGTPLQILLALVFKIIHFFRSSSLTYVEDVLLNSDMYLSVANSLITALTSGLLLYAGYQVYRSTRSVFYALIVQTAPFMPIIWYDLIGRIAPELIMPFPVILMTVLIIAIYFNKQNSTWKQVILFSLISAFGLTIKLNYFPLWLIPFMIIEGWKKRLFYVGLALLFFFLIAFPVTLQFHVFSSWVKNLIIHSGTYGTGDANFIDFASVRTNLREIVGYEKRFFYLFLGLLLVLTIYIALFRKKAEKRIVLLTLAIIFTISVQLILVGKHYAHRYFIPVLMLSPLMAFTLAELIKRIFPAKPVLYLINAGIIALLIWNFNFNKQWFPIKTEAMGTDIKNRKATWHVAQLLEKDSYKIIASQNYGSPFIEYTLMYSSVWASHKKREEYAPILRRLFPYTYNYFTWDNTLKFWGEQFNAQSILDSGKKVFLYMERDEEDLYQKTITKLKEENSMPFRVERELTYQNPATNEIIYQLQLILSESQGETATD